MGYQTMGLDAIKALPVGDLVVSGWLLLWVTRDLFRRGAGVEVAKAWGFTDVAEIIWEKPRLGTGAFPRPCHEPLLICRKGDARSPADRSTRSVQKWRPQNGQHSAKPPAAYDLAEAHFPGPYVELFARAPRLGWDHWGHGYEIGAA